MSTPKRARGGSDWPSAFDPKSEQGEVNLERALQELVPLEPAYVSVTYGAGGSTREKTIDIVWPAVRPASTSSR